MHKELIFRDGVMSKGEPPVDLGDIDRDTLLRAGYRMLYRFGMSEVDIGFALDLLRHSDGDQHLAIIDYGSEGDIVFIPSKLDFLEFMKQFGGLGRLAATSAILAHLEEIKEMSFDPKTGILRDQVRDHNSLKGKLFRKERESSLDGGI